VGAAQTKAGAFPAKLPELSAQFVEVIGRHVNLTGGEQPRSCLGKHGYSIQRLSHRVVQFAGQTLAFFQDGRLFGLAKQPGILMARATWLAKVTASPTSSSKNSRASL